MASTYTPRYTLTNKARPANPELPSPPASRPNSPLSSRSTSPTSTRSTSPSASTWRTFRQRENSGSGDLPSPTTTTTKLPNRASQATNWRRGSGDLPTPTTPPPSPPRRHRDLTGSWRSGTTPQSTHPEWTVGRVVFIPDQSQIPASSVVHKHVQSSPWNHPAVITKTWEVNGVKLVKIRNCTTFGGKGLESKQEHHRHYFIEADRDHLTNDSGDFYKQTWVNCSPKSEITIEHEHLRVHMGKGKRTIHFSPASLAEFNKNEHHYRNDSLFNWS